MRKLPNYAPARTRASLCRSYLAKFCFIMLPFHYRLHPSVRPVAREEYMHDLWN